MHIGTSIFSERPLITITEAARALGYDRRTVSRWLKNSEVDGVLVYLNGRPYVRSARLLDLLSGATPTSNIGCRQPRLRGDEEEE